MIGSAAPLHMRTSPLSSPLSGALRGAQSDGDSGKSRISVSNTQPAFVNMNIVVRARDTSSHHLFHLRFIQTPVKSFGLP